MAKKEKKVEVQDNELDVQMNRVEKFLEQKNNRNMIYIVMAVIVAIVAIGSLWYYFSEKNQKAAEEMMWESELAFQNGQYEEALQGFETVISEHGSTKSGNLAHAYAGLCQKNLGNHAEAINLLKEFDGTDNVIAPAVLSALGDCYVDQENPDYKKAAEVFEKAAKAADNAQFTPLFLKKAGMAYQAAGDNAAALKCYEAIKNNWAETFTAISIDKYIESVK